MAEIYVHENWRRKGVARALMAAIAQDARSRGHRFIWWVSHPENTDAQGFYASVNATHEPMISHAVTCKTFDALADEAAKSDS